VPREQAVSRAVAPDEVEIVLAAIDGDDVALRRDEPPVSGREAVLTAPVAVCDPDGAPLRPELPGVDEVRLARRRTGRARQEEGASDEKEEPAGQRLRIVIDQA
jgi:hypothetical protein